MYCKSVVSSSRFIRVGGYRLLNSWLTYSKTTNNTPLLQLILLTLQKLPLKVDHLKQVCLTLPTRTHLWFAIKATVSSASLLMPLSSHRTIQPNWWSSWARVQRLKVSLLEHQKSNLFLYRQQNTIYPTLSFIFRSEEAGFCARRWLDGHNPLSECLEQWQLSCWYRMTFLPSKCLFLLNSVSSQQQFVTHSISTF